MAVRERGQIGVVGHEHQRASAVRFTTSADRSLPAGRAIEVAGGLVGQEDRPVVGQRPRDGDPLLLAARELRRVVVAAALEADFANEGPCPRGGVRCAGGIPIGTRTFSSAVRVGIRWKNWKTMPTFSPRRRAKASSPRAVMSAPSRRTRPVVGVSRPAMRPSSVDLPLPDGPVTATARPRSMRSDVGWRIVSGPARSSRCARPRRAESIMPRGPSSSAAAHGVNHVRSLGTCCRR